MAGKEEVLGYVKGHAVADDVESVLTTIDQFSERHEGLYHLGAEKGAFLDAALWWRRLRSA